MRGIPTIVWVIGGIVLAVVLITLITGKAPSATSSFGVTASAPGAANPLSTPANAVLV